MDGKYWSTYRVTYHAIPCMPEDGSVTFLSGGLAIKPSPGTTVVSSAFAAVETLAKALAVELSPRRFNTIRPGTIATDLWSFKSDDEREQFYQQAAEAVPAKRIGQPIDIGHAVVFLMTNSFVTGTVLEVNGGWSLT
jgi:NAD(P)-dependent dehydrogenase (short-subunit alcohol dehydrogenase family)